MEINFQNRTKGNSKVPMCEGCIPPGKYLRNPPLSPFQGLSGGEFKRHFPCGVQPSHKLVIPSDTFLKIDFRGSRSAFEVRDTELFFTLGKIKKIDKSIQQCYKNGMKKIIPMVYFLTIGVTVFSQIHIPNFIRHWAEDEFFYVGYNNQLYECVRYEKIYRNITHLCHIDNNGYLRINYTLGDTSYFIQKERPHFLILSPKQLFVFMSDERIGLGNSYTTVPPEFNNFANIFIESITSNVFLREHHFEYSPQNLLSRFYRTDAGFPYDYWSRTLPLAMSQEQMNVFEMEIKFQTEVEGILLLNGFVDFFRTHLYKNNGRVREFKIIDKHNNFEQNYVIEDKIEFQEIMFPQLSDNIVIKIISSYEGNRFTDICLSAIIPIYNAAMYREAKLYPELDYDSFIKEMFANYREVN